MNNILRLNRQKRIFANSKRNFLHFNCIYNKTENCVTRNKNEKINFDKNIHKLIARSYVNFDNKSISSSKRRKIYLLTLLLTGVFGYGSLIWKEKRNVTNFLNEMKEITDDIFDNMDNIVLFVLDKNKLNEEKKNIQEIKNEIEKLNIKNINFLYTYNEESKEYACYLYKGRRRRNITKQELASNFIEDIFEPFFTPVSEDYEKINEGNNGNFPICVTHDTFEKEIIEDSKKNEIILVLFENTCFLCFLYKPFINTLHKLFKENNIQLKLKKYNIEKNDYAPNMIVCRGTPTFLFYHNGKGNKLDEYKPNDIINKIDQIIKSPKNIKEQMLAKADLIHERMHQFGYLTMWMTESKIIENMLIKRHIKDISSNTDDDTIYNEVLTALIEEDTGRNDLIEDSLSYMKEKINEAEKSCFVVAMMMAKELIDEEKKNMT
ncbi:thioredoxin-like protein [Plasmodium brasilianum]|uniref:Thioredoxin, putative n=2 Tax=Plasmodium (Plasmodium) TaxID=418103 RepID=A0A1D3JIK3_PLAMA|nr:thioredoxin, putative [Plasmodium malariae]KAI4840722.1 thioredoxin-like protein [Plasmodium brasilianum]SBT86288.1 thioredoxin, putative [Plasmodium malariae]